MAGFILNTARFFHFTDCCQDHFSASLSMSMNEVKRARARWTWSHNEKNRLKNTQKNYYTCFERERLAWSCGESAKTISPCGLFKCTGTLS